MPRNPNNPWGGCWRNTEKEVLAVLYDIKSGTVNRIAAILDLDVSTIDHWIKILHEAKKIHVSGYERRAARGRARRIFALGNLPDEPPPPKLTGTEIVRAYRARKKLKEQLYGTSKVRETRSSQECSSDLSCELC